MQELEDVNATVNLREIENYKRVNALTLGDSTEHNKQDVCDVVHWKSAKDFGQ